MLTLGVRGDGGRSHILATAEALAARGSRCTKPAAAAMSPTTVPDRSSAIPIIDLNPDRRDVHRYVRDSDFRRTPAANHDP